MIGHIVQTWITQQQLLIVFATLAAILVCFLVAQLAFVNALRKEPYSRLALHYLKVIFILARPPVRSELVARMFPITRPSARPDSVPASWRIWHRVHLPPYAARATRFSVRWQRSVIESVFTGFTVAVQAATKLDDGVKRAITFDEFWPMLECIEELAVFVRPQNRRAFAKAVTKFAEKIEDETVQAQLGWVVNELLERTAAEQRLGLRVGLALLRSESVASRDAIRTLIGYKGQKGGTLDRKFRILDRAVSKHMASFPASRRTEEPSFDPAWAAMKAVTLRMQAFQAWQNETEVIELSENICKQCDELLSAAAFTGVDGILTLASLRLVLNRMYYSIPPDQLSNAPLAQYVCEGMMRRLDTGVPGFIIIESCESIRDNLPADAARAMAAFLGKSRGALDAGIAVCIAEGVEDEVQKLGRDATKVFRMTQFRWSRGRWQPPPEHEHLRDIHCFWRNAPRRLEGTPRDDVPQWMNLRLGLRGVAIPSVARKGN